ncbi:TetR/AcrR family transcriptional regulator [Salinibacillus aidingensis]
MKRKKEQILRSAIKVVNNKGYVKATMEEIAAELLMTKGSLYYYFKNKSDLIFQCHRFILSDAVKDLETVLKHGEGSTSEILQQMVAIHIDYAVDEKDTFNLIMEPKNLFNNEQIDLVLNLRKQYENLFDQIIKRGIETGEFKTRDQTIARMIILGAMNWIQQWYSPAGRLSKEELVETYTDYILKILK